MGGFTYNIFCPVAKASELFAERWTPLILHELLMGSRRFNQIEAGLPGISRALLSKRLRRLEQEGIIERRSGPRGHVEYHLTPCGQELEAVIECLGHWGQRWFNGDLRPTDLNPPYLIRLIQRRFPPERLPEQRVVVRFDFVGARKESWWLLLKRSQGRPDLEICNHDPGYEVDLLVSADTLTLHRVWIGRQDIWEALERGLIRLEGPPELERAFPTWLSRSPFAAVPPAPGAGSGVRYPDYPERARAR
jgi:DNA-binding HxlR family transcriptional regulator